MKGKKNEMKMKGKISEIEGTRNKVKFIEGLFMSYLFLPLS